MGVGVPGRSKFPPSTRLWRLHSVFVRYRSLPRRTFSPVGSRIWHLQLVDSMREGFLQSLVLTLLFGVVQSYPRMEVVDGDDPGLQHLFQAAEAGLSGGVNGSSLDADAKARGRENGVLLGVNADAKIVGGARFVGLVAVGTAQAATVGTVLHFGGSSVVSGRDDAVVDHDDGSDLLTPAIRPFADSLRNAHEIDGTSWAFWKWWIHWSSLLR